MFRFLIVLFVIGCIASIGESRCNRAGLLGRLRDRVVVRSRVTVRPACAVQPAKAPEKLPAPKK